MRPLGDFKNPTVRLHIDYVVLPGPNGERGDVIGFNPLLRGDPRPAVRQYGLLMMNFKIKKTTTCYGRLYFSVSAFLLVLICTSSEDTEDLF